MKAEKIYTIPLILTTSLLFLSPLAVSNLLFDGLITSKMMAVEKVALPVTILLAAALLLKHQVRITTADILVLTFFAWCTLSELFIHNNIDDFSLSAVYSYTLWMVIWLSVRIIAQNRIAISAIAAIWMAVTLIIAIMGLMQLYGLKPSKHNIFSITGPFHNPGPFSGWIVAALPLALSYIIEFYRKDSKCGPAYRNFTLFRKNLRIVLSPTWYIRYLFLALSLASLTALFLVLPPAASRASWIAGAAAAVIVIIDQDRRSNWRAAVLRKIKSLRTLTRALVVVGILVILMVSTFGLYTLKKESVDGRLLVWRVTATLIGEKPLFGHGADSFSRDYMQAQAAWFESGRGTSQQVDRAGSPNYTFNELLSLWLEKGLIAVAIALLCLYVLFHAGWTPSRVTRPQNNEDSAREPGTNTKFYKQLTGSSVTGIKGALTALVVFSLFSYPFNLAPFNLQLVTATAILAAYSRQVFVLRGNLRWLITLPVAIIILLLPLRFFQTRKDYYNAVKEWREAHSLYTIKAYDASTKSYNRALPAMSKNGLFLQMYGKALSQAGHYQRSNEVLTMANNYLSSQIISLTQGDNYRTEGASLKAEKAYRNAINMMPGMLYPKYQLFMLYMESGQKEGATLIAKEILSMCVRIESSATRQIIDEVQTISKNQLTDEL